mmetsp:Transcript_70004/g.167196  ORF Transcript_70004/g.167196 Transcript_70004/m.167196 type:complete len:232 (-) Transcript_70004:1384-2079(-)
MVLHSASATSSQKPGHKHVRYCNCRWHYHVQEHVDHDGRSHNHVPSACQVRKRSREQPGADQRDGLQHVSHAVGPVCVHDEQDETCVQRLCQKDLSHHGLVEVCQGQRPLKVGHGDQDILQNQVDQYHNAGGSCHDADPPRCLQEPRRTGGDEGGILHQLRIALRFAPAVQNVAALCLGKVLGPVGRSAHNANIVICGRTGVVRFRITHLVADVAQLYAGFSFAVHSCHID